MSQFRLIFRAIGPPLHNLLKDSNHHCISHRFAGHYKRTKKSVVGTNHLAGVRERLRQKVSPLSPQEWKEFRDEVLSSSRSVDEINADAILIGLCNAETQLRVAESYLDFLKSEGKTPNYATIGRILRMYYPAYQKGELIGKDEEKILEIYEKLRTEHEILDETTCENLITALVVTSQWKETINLMNMIKVTSNPSVGVYSLIATKAFESKEDLNIGWKMLKEMCNAGKQPKCEVFLQYFKTIKKEPKSFHKNLDNILQVISDYGLIVSKAVINGLQDVTNSFKIQSKIAKLAKDGRCSCCGKRQPDITITEKEFENLSSSFMDKVLIREDVFLKSSPDEVEKFLQFIDKEGLYDCVIDGLNVAFSTGTNKPPIFYAKTLASVVKYFKAKGLNILVLGREHMNKWPQEPMNYIKQNANLFLTGNLSQDDPFLLYATIKSGPKADFVSRDLMRSHAFLLGGELKHIFRRWQQQHQYMVFSNDQGKVAIKAPIKYNLSASKINSTWHVPFKEEYSATPGETYEVPQFWLCLSSK